MQAARAEGGTLNMALSLSKRSGRFFRGSSLVVCSSSFQSLVWKIQFQHRLYSLTRISTVLRQRRSCRGWRAHVPVRGCAPRSLNGRCRHLQRERSPWRGPPVGLSSCTAGKVLLSFQTGVAELCNDSFNWDKDQVKRQDWHLCSR